MTNIKNRLVAWSLVLAPVVIAAQGCDKVTEAADATKGLCCEDFKVGADLTAVDFGISAEADAKLFGAFLQASADFAAVAVGITDDVSLACQAIAIDLGAKEDSVQETDPTKKVAAWCASAVGSLDASLKAAGTVSVSFSPPKCSASISASAKCEGGCSASAECKVEPGKIEGKCEGGEMSFKCEGGCKGSCEGSATLAVECTGACEGTCEGKCDGNAMVGSDGNSSSGKCGGKCEGKCRGTCKAEAMAMVECKGSCSGECMGSASAPKCSGKFTPPEGKCNASADCKGSCNASASAKAECSPPSVDLKADAMLDAMAFAKLEGTLKANLPNILIAAKARGSALVEIGKTVVTVGVNVSGKAPGFSLKAGLCIIPAVKALAAAGANIEASIPAAVSIVGKIGG